MTEALIEAVVRWHHDRNLIEGSTSQAQIVKLAEEFGELAGAVARGAAVQDHVGDMLVVLINIVEREGTTLGECLGVAYEEIRHRKGRMVDGLFIKEEHNAN